MRWYFSGYARGNPSFRQGGFGPGNEKIMSIFAGAGKTESAFAANVKSIAGGFKGAALVSFLFSGFTAYEEWRNDLKNDKYDLIASLLMAAVLAVVATSLATAIVTFIGAIIVATGAAVPVVVVGAITFFVYIASGYLVVAVDKSAGVLVSGNEKNTSWISAIIAPHFRDASNQIQNSWRDLMKKFPNDYKEIIF